MGSSVEPLVDFLCSELAAAFRAEGATLPPWRAADAMLSKWRPRRSVDCDMLAPLASAAHSMARSPFTKASSGDGGKHGGMNGSMGDSVSRRSGSSRPSKSQRLSSTRSSPHGSLGGGGASASARVAGSLLAGGASSFRAGSSFLNDGSFVGGRPLALDKSVSKVRLRLF